MAGEHAPAGTTKGPSAPGVTENVKFPRPGPCLQISRKPVRLSVNVTSVTPVPIVTSTLPMARLAVPTIWLGGTTSMLETT